MNVRSTSTPAVCGATMRRCRRAAGCRPRLLAIPPFQSARAGAPVQAPKTASLFGQQAMAMDLRRRNKQHVMETVEGKDPPRTHGLLAIGARMSAFSGCSTTSVEGTSFRGRQFD